MNNNPFSRPIDQGRMTPNKRYQNARFGRVLRVDYENWEVELLWGQFNSGVQNVPIPMAFSTPRAVLGGMPETGSDTVVDFTHGNAQQGKPVITTYVPSGFKAGINQRLQKEIPVDIEIWENPTVRRKFRKIFPGEIIGSSTQGSDFILDENVYLQDMKGDEIRLDPRDQSVNLVSLQNYQVTDAARHYSGWIYRPTQESYNEAGANIPLGSDTGLRAYSPDSQQDFMIDESGKVRWYRTLNGVKTVDDYFLSGGEDTSSLPLTEVRSEIRELGHASLPLVDQTVDYEHWSDVNSGNIIETVAGTLVGYDKNNAQKYGHVLMPQIFPRVDGADIDIQELSIEKGAAPDYTPERYQAAAFMWKMPQPYSQTRMYATKEGHVHLHVGSTWEAEDSPFQPPRVHKFGAGRSLEAHFAGSIKAVVDKNQQREESLDLKTIGKVYFHFGKDDGVASNVRRHRLLDGSNNYIGGVSRPLLSDAPGAIPTAKHWSIEGVTDGGVNLRLGRTHGRNIRQYERNGFTSEGNRYLGKNDVRDVGRGNYPQGDQYYRHHDLTLVGEGAPGRIGSDPEDKRSPAAVTSPNMMGSSLDVHAVGNAFLRFGDDHDGNSIILDAKGALAAALGAETKDNRSIVMSLDGGIEANIGRMATSGNSIQAVLAGGINLTVRGDNSKRLTNNITMEGNQIMRYRGEHTMEVQGKMVQKTSLDMIQNIGANHTQAIMKNQFVSVTGYRATTIGNVPPKSIADSLKIVSGNYEMSIETKGDVSMQTKMGKLMFQTLLGDASLISKLGNLVMEAMLGKIDIVSANISCGLPLTPKFGVLREMLTPCILAGIPHIMGSPTTKVD